MKNNLVIKCRDKEQVIEARKRLIEMGYIDDKEWNDAKEEWNSKGGLKSLNIYIFSDNEFGIYDNIALKIIKKQYTFEQFFAETVNQRMLEMLEKCRRTLKDVYGLRVIELEQLIKEATEL